MKKTDLFILSCAFAVSSLCACSKDNMSVHELADSHKQIETIPIEEALSTLDRCLSCLYDPVTRTTSKSYDISKICTVGSSDIFGPMTKSGNETGIPDTLLYVVNFENDNGYAILSANTILSESVFCITETGQMVLDTTGISIAAHPDLGDGIERAVNEWEDRELSDEEAEADTLYISGISPDESERTVQELVVSRVIVDIYNYENTHVKPVEKEVDRPTTGPATNKFGPYLKTKWRQEEPFNKLVPSQYCGCVAIATGQIMVSNRHSNSMTFNGKSCNWDDLESVCNYASPNFLGGKDAKEQASNFIYELGKKYNINTKYDQGGSGALPKNARRTLKNYGYSNVKLHTGFGKKNQEKAKDQIRHGHPVFLGGNRGLKGHAWVLDGYYYDLDVSLFHINWGWNGAADGYYACGLFDTSRRADTDDEIDENTKDSKLNEDHNYTWCFRMITYD